MSTNKYLGKKLGNKSKEIKDNPKNKVLSKSIQENTSVIPTSNKVQKQIHESQSDKVSKIINFAEEVDLFLSNGLMKQYCVKGSEVILRTIYFIRNDHTRLLTISVDNAKKQTDNYKILFSKDVCPYNFKDADAFVIKVLDSQDKLKSMTFKTSTNEHKLNWLNVYGINLDIAQKLLEGCIEEIEKRRFHLGIKKRHEDRNKIKISPEMLMELLNLIKVSSKVNLTNYNQWSITSLERLIQILLNELVEPLIPYISQKSIRKSDIKSFNTGNETRKVLNILPNKNRIMLTGLLGHMERLSKYYLIVMSSPRKDLPHIRLNICQRLTPIIFRLQEELDSEIIMNRACDVLYHAMLCVNGGSQISDK